jgi:hypothetical protein
VERAAARPYRADMAVIASALVLAHQGGWDELLFVLAPLLIFAGLLALARRRADDMDQDEPAPVRLDQDAEASERADPT